MSIEAKVGDDGMLIAKVSDRFRGKTVRISIREAGGEIASQWDEISQVLRAADALELPRRSHQEILEELRDFRECE